MSSSPALFSHFTLGSLELANRIIVPPMCQYSADDGNATDWHLLHYGNLSQSGAGLIIVEATAVLPEGRITPGDLGLWSDSNECALAAVIRRLRPYALAPLAIQLAHSGRKGSIARPWEGGHQLALYEGGWPTKAPSAMPFRTGERLPEVLSQQEIDALIDAFVSAGQRAARIGFDAIELHAAHGYLLHEFLSPRSNQRSDQYGGSPENRMRLTLDIFTALRESVPKAIPIGVRISATDWLEGGWTLEQSVLLAKALKATGCSYVHVSSGGLSPEQKIPLGPGYQVSLAEAIRREAGIPVITVGLITDPHMADDLVRESKADLVGIARGLIYNPRWPMHAAAELGCHATIPPQAFRCQPEGVQQLFHPPESRD